MNVNTTDATTGATTLLLPAQKTHACVNLHMSTGVKNCLYKHKGGARARPGPVGIPYPGYRLPPRAGVFVYKQHRGGTACNN